MTDLVKLLFKAGNGGRGRVSFLREKYRPKGGPDGGTGGNGGHVILRADKSLASLKHLASREEMGASDGEMGGARQRSGPRGEDLVVKVPVGTMISVCEENEVARRRRMTRGLEKLFKSGDVSRQMYEQRPKGKGHGLQDPVALEKHSNEGEESDETLSPAQDGQECIEVFELTSHGQEVILCQGGFGGRGNMSFKSPARTTPYIAELGTVGEWRLVKLELKLWADVGLVGFPNAGKSTLLSVLTKARPKVAAYPFTTLEPHLGVLDVPLVLNEPAAQQGAQELVVADIPGLIEGASQGKGLGHEFLKHVEHCVVLLFVLSLEEGVVFDESIDDGQKAQQLVDQLNQLRDELGEYSQKLAEKPWIIGINKLDLYPESLQNSIEQALARFNKPSLMFSAATKEGIIPLVKALSSES